ncbi:MAG: helix-turn-helix transcriptional regulator [Oscillospiraceae bacterium]|nr:helix-turn-helix transcriptional regulator [Oscillospiraceae bacterium]MCI9363232.1 helix-turn-helix transcriptional regulator [Oscillospiraceae bacterium]
MEFRDILRTRRKALGLTLEEIAQATGVTRATVQRWESGGIRNVRYDKLSKLAKILEVTPAYLMGAAEEKDSSQEVEEYLDELKNRSEMRMLFSVSRDASKEDIMRAVAIIEALKKSGG